MSDTNPAQIHATGEATGVIPAPGDQPSPSWLRLGNFKGKPITPRARSAGFWRL